MKRLDDEQMRFVVMDLLADLRALLGAFNDGHPVQTVRYLDEATARATDLRNEFEARMPQ